MSKMNITPYITSEDLSRLPDQASFKLNTLIDNLTAEMIDREKGDNEGSEALQLERNARINADDRLSAAITSASGDMASAYYQLNNALQAEITNRTDADTALGNRIDAIMGKVYPIGTVYRTTSSANPGTTLGVGTWTRITDYELVAYATTMAPSSMTSSKNISSITKVSEGHYRVNLSKNMSNTNYLVFISGDVGTEGSEIFGVYTRAVNNFLFDVTKYDGTASAPGELSIAVFGQLANPEYYTWKRTA